MKAVATQWMQRYNSLPYEQWAERYSMLKELFGHVGENCSAGDGFICGFGRNIYLGTRVGYRYPELALLNNISIKCIRQT